MLIENKITINKSLKDTWAFYNDEQNVLKWVEGLKSFKVLEGEPGKVGSTSTMTVEAPNGKEMQFVEKVLVLEPEKRFSNHMDGPGMSFTIDARFTGDDSSTTIVSTTDYQPKGFFMKMMMPLMKGQMRKQSQKNFDKLKSLVEAL